MAEPGLRPGRSGAVKCASSGSARQGANDRMSEVYTQSMSTFGQDKINRPLVLLILPQEAVIQLLLANFSYHAALFQDQTPVGEGVEDLHEVPVVER